MDASIRLQLIDACLVSAGFADHEINRGFQVAIAQAGIAALRRHHVEAIECVGVDGVDAFGDARCPRCLVTNFWCAQYTGAMAGQTSGGVDLFTLDQV